MKMRYFSGRQVDHLQLKKKKSLLKCTHHSLEESVSIQRDIVIDGQTLVLHTVTILFSFIPELCYYLYT